MTITIDTTRENMLNAVSKLDEQGMPAFAIEFGKATPKYRCNNGDKCIIGHMLEGVYNDILEGDSITGLCQTGEVTLNGSQPYLKVLELLSKLQDLHDDAVEEYNSGVEVWETTIDRMKEEVNKYFDNIGE